MLELSANFLGGMPFATVGGNHEMVGYGGSQYDILRHFDAKMPQQDCTKGYYYSFDYGDVRFIQLNTNDAFGSSKKLSDEQYNWLVEQLETNDKKWLIVGMHHGMYSVGSWGNDSRIVHITKGLRNQLSDLFAQYGVDLVLQGHDHTYSYTYPIAEGHTALQDAPTEGDYFVNPQGVVYGMHGPAGDQPSDPWETYEEEYYKFAGRGEESSWAEVTVEEDRLTVTVKRYVAGAAEIVTTYGIIKN
jgi:3',5'-cyclic AMP phosphodiesterase CpdA